MSEVSAVTTNRAWRLLILSVLVSSLGIGAFLIVSASRSTPRHLLWPKTDTVTVTGYGKLSPMNPSSDPVSVVLTSGQALELDQLVTTLPMTGLPDCHENSAVFTISVADPSGSSPTWTATDWECPAPGALSMKLLDGIQEVRGQVCVLRSFVTQIFGRNSALGTKSEFKLC
jgi:hypothetical protein